MRSNSREDDLLSKLKNCVGPISDAFNFQQHSVKEPLVSPQQMARHRTPLQNCQQELVLQRFSQYSLSSKVNDQERRKIQLPDQIKKAAYVPQRNMEYRSNSKQKDENNQMVKINQQDKKAQDARYGDIQAKYSSQSRQQRPPLRDIDSTIQNQAVQVKNQLTSRYASTQLYHKPTTTDRQLNIASYEPRSRIPKGSNLSRPSGGTKGYEATTTRNKPQAQQMGSILSSRPSSRPSSVLKHSLQQPGETRQQYSKESALGKLKKISQLNEKINQRIRNIITVFEQHKY